METKFSFLLAITNGPSDRVCPAISKVPAILWKSILSNQTIVMIVNDHMETKGSEKFHYVFTFRFRNYVSHANVSPEIITLDALVEMEIFPKISFVKQGKLLLIIPQIKI